jgi:hypothetical protein
MPFAGHALELVSAALVKLKPRPDHQVAQRAGHEHVVRSCQCADASPDVHGDAADVVAANLALAGVQPGAHLDAERLHASRIVMAQRIARQDLGVRRVIQRAVNIVRITAHELDRHTINATDIAKMLGVSRATVYRYLASDESSAA